MIPALLNMVGGLGIFFIGMKIMSDSIQKSAGDGFHKLLNAMTGNPFFAILTGLLTTAVIQSSSATTVMLVSLVNAGLISLKQSIGVIMGANIGTTLTSWIVSFLGFKIKISSFALPAIAFSLPLRFSKRERLKDISGILLGFGLLFLGLEEMKDAVSGIKDNTAAFEFVQHLTGFGFGSTLLFIFIGTLLTIAVQSSSAAMTITLTFAFNGWIPFPIAASIVLGENIGTTITAYLASLEMNVHAKRTARAHLIFNIIGVIWMIILMKPALALVDYLIPGAANDTASMPFHLSAFHSLFNITNSFLLVWFIPQIEKAVTYLIPMEEKESTGPYKIPTIPKNIMENSTSNLINAQSEVGKMSQVVSDMMGLFQDSIGNDDKLITKNATKMEELDNLTIQMQEELTQYLIDCSLGDLSEAQGLQLSALVTSVNELHRIAHGCSQSHKILQNRPRKNWDFHKGADKEITNYSMMVKDFLDLNTQLLKQNGSHQELTKAEELEESINMTRKKLTKTARQKIKQGGSLKGELFYMEIIRHLEQIGDFSHSMAQAIHVL
ncbi:Na/Pi cotransporter family protein [Spirochaeta cellobiosiphila]|uniref:Na/Pi cotransporter family protein n=1 Tax=Spirochaeta cellobiosiphila TaxID=504483 RepID=UPI0004040125|nr:Na/Pi cotransporter family protein [Spirochaeta cellobiosiphila]